MFEWNQYNFQDSRSPVMEEFLLFNDYLILVLVFITIRVAWAIAEIILPSHLDKVLLEGQFLEAVWTIFPAVILLGIALPSLTLLYRLDATSSSSITFKVLGHQ